jgi:predicted O-methyltransferase YrrM
LHNQQYADFLDYMRSLDLRHISINLSKGPSSKPAWIGGPICAFDSLALYAMIRKNQPHIYLEIGSGMTTCFAKQAIEDGNFDTKLISIDPQPRREINF